MADYFHVALILVAGMAAGFLNVLAGGGSLLTFPLLIFLGLPVAVANGTNRIALTFQNLVAVAGFGKKGYFDWRTGVLLGLPAAFGAIIGARLAVFMPGPVFQKVLGVVMLLVMAFIVWQPKSREGKEEKPLVGLRRIVALVVFFCIGFYGGLIQLGVGFIIIAALTFIGHFSLVRINSLKVLVVFIYLIPSLAVFALNGDVNYVWGVTLALGMGVGSWLGTHVAVTRGEKWIKAVLVVAVVLAAVKLFL